MDSIFEAVFNSFIEIVKFVFYVVLWSYVFFYIGFAILKIFTLFNYPRGMQLKKQINVISGVGFNGIFISWACIATYNFNGNIYFLIAGIVVAILQILVISLKYYSQDRGQYEF